ncbi:hypothetical protein GCM10023190_00960 [Enteractinococcus fodinae]
MVAHAQETTRSPRSKACAKNVVAVHALYRVVADPSRLLARAHQNLAQSQAVSLKQQHHAVQVHAHRRQ